VAMKKKVTCKGGKKKDCGEKKQGAREKPNLGGGGSDLWAGKSNWRALGTGLDTN